MSSTKGANVTDTKGDNIRTLFFSQQVLNPDVSGPSNPFANTLQQKFPATQQFGNCRMALQSLNLFNSWYNIEASRGNNVFTYSWPNSGGTYNTYTVTLPDGAYDTIEELQAEFEKQMQNNSAGAGTYFIYTDPSTNLESYVYFLSLDIGNPEYAFSINATPVPTAAEFAAAPWGADYSFPANYPGGASTASLPPTATDPYLTVLSTPFPTQSNTPGFYSFSKTIGFTPGTYPPPHTTVTYSTTGEPPVLEATTAVTIACNFVNQGNINTNPQAFYIFAPNAPFGSEIQIVPPYPTYVKIADGNGYIFFQLQFFDDNNQLLQIRDPAISGAVIIQG